MDSPLLPALLPQHNLHHQSIVELLVSNSVSVSVNSVCLACHADTADASQAQLQLLLAELKRIEGQQQQLKKAAAENQVLIVHPVEGFKADDVDEYAEPEEVKPDPDRFVPSGQQQLIIYWSFMQS